MMLCSRQSTFSFLIRPSKHREAGQANTIPTFFDEKTYTHRHNLDYPMLWLVSGTAEFENLSTQYSILCPDSF